MHRKIIKIIGGVLICLILCILGIFFYLTVESNKTLTLPQPTGSYKIGRTIMNLTDENRANTFAGKPNEKRKLMISIWYPTDQKDRMTTPYIPSPWLEAAEKDQSGFGGLLTHKLTNIQTHSYADAPVSTRQKKYPVIIFEPGLGRASYDYTSITENLASHGFIVISSTPTYLADMVVFPNGEIIQSTDKLTIPDTMSPLDEPAATTMKQIEDVYTGDIIYTLSQLDLLNTSSKGILAEKFDLSHIGIMGHSLGGASAYRVCLTDNRCKAVVDIDGTLFGEKQSVNKVPFMFVSSDTSNDTNEAKKEDSYNTDIFSKQVSPLYQLTVKGAEHFNFSDIAIRSPLFRYLGILGDIDSEEGIKITNAYLVDMFGVYLQNNKPQLINQNRNTKSIHFISK